MLSADLPSDERVALSRPFGTFIPFLNPVEKVLSKSQGTVPWRIKLLL